MDTPRIVQLSRTISSSVDTIETFLSQQGHQFPTFAANGETGLPSDLSAAQDAVLDATMELHDLLLPAPILLHTKGNHIDMVSLQAVTRLGIARSFAADEQISFGALSKTVGIDESLLKRFLRHSITMRIFSEPKDGFLAHTNASLLLAEENTHNWISMGCEDMWPSATKTVDAILRWPDFQEPNQTGFSIANNTSQSMYETISTDSARAERMAGAMKAFTASPVYDVSHALNIYNWEALGNCTVVDVGGSKGHIAIALAKRFRNLNIIVQDMASVIEGAALELPAEVASRVRFMEHDLFSEQPKLDISGNIVYHLRWIFHNWSDKYSIKILQNLIPALKNGTRILIQETCMPKPGDQAAAWRMKSLRYLDQSLVATRFRLCYHMLTFHQRSADLTMLSTFNGKERDIDDWKRLFQDASSNFNFVGVKHGKGSALSFIEAIWMVDE